MHIHVKLDQHLLLLARFYSFPVSVNKWAGSCSIIDDPHDQA